MTKTKTETVEEKPAGKLVSAEAFAPPKDAAPDDKEFTYWVGLYPDAGTEGVDCGGLNFPKFVQPLETDPTRSSMGRRPGRPRAGQIVRLSRRRLDLLAERLPRLYYRFRFLPAEGSEPPGYFTKGATPPRPQCVMLQVPTEEQLAAAEQRGRRRKAYVPQRGDRWVSEFVYIVPVPNGKRHPDDTLPPPLVETGLQYPPDDEPEE